jgi:indole-3-glycerol phosphate synthase
MSPDFLPEMIARRRKAVGAAVGSVMEAALGGFDRETLDMHAALSGRDSVTIIAEVKKASPSAGDIAPDTDVAEQATAYEAGGAAAVSILAEPSAFGGSFSDIATARAAVGIPVLCKDFVVHHNQLLIARSRGADAILLMVSVLGERTGAFVKAAHDCGLDALVEIHGADEYEIAREAGSPLIGVNARDLRTLDVDVEGTFAMIERASADGFCVVAESGIHGRDDVERAAAAGASAVLVGEFLMRSNDPRAEVEGMTGVPVRARQHA